MWRGKMTEPEPRPKLFEVEEANQLLPQVREILRQLRKRRNELEQLEKKKAVEELAWLQPDGTVSPKAQVELERLNQLQEKQMEAFEKSLGQLNSMGAQLKDLDAGLVDFFTARGDELVYLCWKDGEDEIRHWHDLESGFAGRRPLAEF